MKPTTLAAVAVALVVGYYLYKRSQEQAAAAQLPACANGGLRNAQGACSWDHLPACAGGAQRGITGLCPIAQEPAPTHTENVSIGVMPGVLDAMLARDLAR